MRRLISLCRKSPFIERSLRRDNLPSTLAVLTMLVVVSCQELHQQPGSEIDAVVAADGAKTLAQATSSTPAAPIMNEDAILLLNGKTKTIVATIGNKACAPELWSVDIDVVIASSFGDFPVHLTMSPLKTPRDAALTETVHAQVDGYTATFPTTAALGKALLTLVCNEDKPKELTLDQTIIAHFSDVLERVAPDCDHFEMNGKGFTCRLPTVDPEAAKEELVGIQTTMIRRWSRQPYLLARRLALGVTLAQALQANDVNRSLDSFCRLIQSAMPLELSATMASKRWQAATCGKVQHRRADAALFGLGKTIAEIDAMRQLFERTSLLGHLAVKIPAKLIDSDRILVSLTPEADVAENLARETQKLWASPASDAAPEDTPRACWHPVFGEKPELMQLARQLALAGDTDQLACTSPTPPVATIKSAFSSDSYFAESITSETEFVVSNGHAKTLRLPLGHYSYTLRALPADPGTWDDASQVSSQTKGTIPWDAKRPYAVITTW